MQSIKKNGIKIFIILRKQEPLLRKKVLDLKRKIEKVISMFLWSLIN